MRLAIVASHPVQYYAPLFRNLAWRLDLTVFFAHRAGAEDQARAGFGVGFQWDVDLLEGFDHAFLANVSRQPGVDAFSGCDIPEIGQRLSKGRFDAVMVMGWRLKSDIQAVLAARRLGLPLLARGDSQLASPRSPLKRLAKSLAYPPLLRAFNAALYVGRRSRDYWRHYRYPADRLFFSPHCIDTDWFAARATAQARRDLRERLGIAPERPAVLFAGKLLPFKRPLDLIAAVERLGQGGLGVAVIVAGAGPLEVEMAAAAGARGVEYHPLGFRNQSEMPAAYAAADVLALPSDGRETWGLVANEALACGRPIVISEEAGAAPDLAEDGAVGRTFKVGDIAGLAEALRTVLSRPPPAEAIAARSAAYSLTAASDGIEEALEQTRRRRYGIG